MCVSVHHSAHFPECRWLQKQFGIMLNWSGLWQIIEIHDVIFYRLLNQDVKDDISLYAWNAFLYSLSILAAVCVWDSGVKWLRRVTLTTHSKHREETAHQTGMEKRALAWTVDLVVMRSKCNDLMWLKQQNKGSAGTFVVINARWKWVHFSSRKGLFCLKW